MLKGLCRCAEKLAHNVGADIVCAMVAAIYVAVGVAFWMFLTSTSLDLLWIKMAFEPRYTWVVIIAWIVLVMGQILSKNDE